MIKRKGIIVLIGLLCSFSAYGQKVALKTNLVADATSTINLSYEVSLGAKQTFDIYANYNPWKFGDHKQFKHLLLQPEWRYWFCERFTRHFIGIHAHAAIFNVGGVNMPFGLWKDLEKYRYEGELYGAGISYGYQWILGQHLNLEANIGIGYAYIHYDKYKCRNCGRLVEKGGKYQYFGPTKAAISLVYLF